MTNLSRLEEGAALTVKGKDYLVAQVLRFGAGSLVKANFRLQDGGQSLWLCLRDYSSLTLVLAQETTQITSLPREETFSFQDKEYQRMGQGQAKVIAPSAQGFKRFLNMEYADYRLEKEWLLFNLVQGRLTVLEGRELSLGQVAVYGKPRQ
jgi:hypothetical protein